MHPSTDVYVFHNTFICVQQQSRPQEEYKEKFEEEVNNLERQDEAATKIQAGYRGHRARKEVNKMKEDNKVLLI